MLRRSKSDILTELPPKKEIHVYVGLTDIQVKLYTNLVLTKNLQIDSSKRQYLNLLMQLVKVCNHPYLFEGVEDEKLPAIGVKKLSLK